MIGVFFDQATKWLVESSWVEELDEELSSTTVGSGETMAVRSTGREKRDRKRKRAGEIKRRDRIEGDKGKGRGREDGVTGREKRERERGK